MDLTLRVLGFCGLTLMAYHESIVGNKFVALSSFAFAGVFLFLIHRAVANS
jgi:hypothetical protein